MPEIEGGVGTEFSRRQRFAKAPAQNLKRRAVLPCVNRNTSSLLSPERLDELFRPRLSRACTGRPCAPAERRNTKPFGRAQRAAAAGAPLHGTRYRRLPAAGGGGAHTKAGDTKAGAAAPLPAPPRWFRGVAGHRVPHRLPGPPAPGRARSRRRPLPAAPLANKAPALTGGLALSAALAHPLLLPLKIRAQGCGRLHPPTYPPHTHTRPVTHSAAAPGVPPAAPAPQLPPSARALGSGLISKLPPPPSPPVRAGESVELPSSMQLPQPSRCLSPSPGRPGPAPGCS